MSTYKVTNLDCPVCAAKVEEGLRKFPGVKSASIDFATLSLKLEAEDHAAALAAAARLEPGLVFEKSAGPLAPAIEETGAYRPRREAALLGAALVLAIAGWVLAPAFGRIGAPWLSLALYLAAWALAGWNVALGAARELFRGQPMGELFLMTVATIGAFALGEYEEAVGVMVFYKVGELLQEGATLKSRRSIRALLALRPDSARVRRSGAWVRVAPEAVEVGEEVLVRPGERVPLDAEVLEGSGSVDTAAMTGESVPRAVGPGDAVLSGFIVRDAALVMRAQKSAGESSAARIVELVENAAHAKAPTERLVARFARYYTPAVVGLAAAVALLPPLLFRGQSFADWGYRALVMLVISCPCALVVSVPLGYFGGLGGAARRGILVKGANVLDALAEASVVVLDKTGTLTRGVFELRAVQSATPGGADQLLALAASAESRSTHPAARALVAAAEKRGLSLAEPVGLSERAGKGLEAMVNGRAVLVGTALFLAERGVALPPVAFAEDVSGATIVHAAVDGSWAGRFLLGDELRADAAEAVRRFRAAGVRRVELLSGDAEAPVRAAAEAVGADSAAWELLPEDKLRRLEKLIAEERARDPKGKVLFLGDGINDAPVLARADCGIAMGGAGADVAVETADAVLMTDEPSRAAEAVERAKRTRTIVVQNIIGALLVKGAFLALGAAGEAPMWIAVIGDVGVALAAVLNSTRAMR
ncbi:MAG: cadmium-translocating P-type ATPase [Spirochaetales bacterium]|nr:cadmium-translocating P-type ATPase [Spirochaetales bacterium]